MLFSIVVVLIVILVAAFWAYQGMFSSIIMFFECVLAAMLAFMFHEQVHSLWEDSLDAGLGLPLAFIVVFALALFVMRILTDKLIPNNVSLNLYVDRAGGALFGFFTGMILIGAALTAMQMLPIGSGILGFERFEVDKKTGLTEQKNFVFKPDAFTVGLASMMSNDRRFGGGNDLRVAKPDLLLDLYGARACPQTESRMVIPADSIKVTNYWDFHQIDHAAHSASEGTLVREFSTQPPDAGRKFLVCQIRVDPKAADKEGGQQIRFRVPQFRLVGPRPASQGPVKPPHVYLACGLSDVYTHRELQWKAVRAGQTARLVRFSPLTDLILDPVITKAAARTVAQEAGQSVQYYELNVVFEVPDDPDFKPWYVEFKRGARVELNDKMKIDAPDYLKSALQANGGASTEKGGETQEPPKVGEAPGGTTHVADVVEERTDATALLPVPLDRNNSAVARALKGGKLAEGNVLVEVKDDLPEGSAAVTELWVPPGKRIVQLGAEKNMPAGVLARALNYAAKVAAQIVIYTDDGKQYFAQGVYAYAPVEGKNYFEIQYYPEADIPERCLKDMQKLKDNLMKSLNPGQRKFGFIFVVDPGVKIVSFSAGSKQRQSLNIQVPP